jgi:PAS domain S-box-containing protein
MTKSAADNFEASLGGLYQVDRVIADTASDAIITIDEESMMLFVNHAAERIFGYPQAELVGQPLTKLIPDYLKHFQPERAEKHIEAGPTNISADVCELPGLHSNGREIPLEISFSEFTENGRRLLTLVARDITQRHRFERRLEAQFQIASILAQADSMTSAAPALLQAIGENFGWELGLMWSVDRSANVLRHVAAWHAPAISESTLERESRGRTFERGVGLPGRIWESGTSDWITDLGNDRNFTLTQSVTSAGFRSAFGLPIRIDHDVSEVMEFFSRHSQAPDQTLLGIMNIIGQQLGHFVDRQRSEEERARTFEREQRARLEIEAAIDRMRRVQTVTDVALSHLSMDDLLTELLTRIRDAMNVDTVAILLLESEGDELRAWAARGLEEEVELGVRIPVGVGFAGKVADTKKPVIINDLETADILNPPLREKGIRALLGVPLLVEGRVIGVIHTGTFAHYHFTDDDTHLLQLVADRIALAIENARLFEEERTARREAEAASRAKDEFLTTISHELRTPLTPIIGWIHMIRNGILPDKETVHGLSVIEKNSQALKRLINDLLDMSAILSGKMRMEQSPVPLEQVLREAVETVRPLAVPRNIEITVSFYEWHNEIVSGDRARLVQVFWNLLHNAVKFSSSGGRIEVSATAGESEIAVRIKDSGQGITPEFLPFVFDRFRQADGSKTRAHGGLGLGLALVKSFVEAHKGKVEVESQGLDRGSCFTVRLPRPHSQHDIDRQPAVHAYAAPIETTYQLMIVEDDPDTLEMLRATLEARGFGVRAYESAAAALAAASEAEVDLIISDIGMPEMDGFHLIRKMREIPRYAEVPAIALSGYASQKDAKAALAAGFNSHVSKPVEPAELVITVNGLLQKKLSS